MRGKSPKLDKEKGKKIIHTLTGLNKESEVPIDPSFVVS
jgi:hypothetical protein